MQQRRPRSAAGKILWWPVLMGFLIDNLLSIFIVSVGDSLDPALATTPYSTFATTTGVVVWVLQILSTGLGGLIAARLARHERVLHGVLVGALGLGLVLMMSFFDAQFFLSGLDLALVFLAILAGVIGGYLSRWIPSRQDS